MCLLAVNKVAIIYFNQFSYKLLQSLSVFLIAFNLSCSHILADNISSPPETITISTPVWPNWANQDGSGFYIELIQAIYNPKGIKTKVDINNYMRSRKLVKEGDSDIVIGVFQRTTTDPELITPFYPIDKEDFVVISKKEHSWNTTKDLKGTKIIIPRGYLEKEFQPFDFERVGVNESDQGLKMLFSGRGKHLIITRIEAHEHAKYLNIDINDLHIKTVTVEFTYLGFTNNDKGRLLANIYDEQFPLLVKNGTIKRLYQKANLQPHTLLQLPAPWLSEID